MCVCVCVCVRVSAHSCAYALRVLGDKLIFLVDGWMDGLL